MAWEQNIVSLGLQNVSNRAQDVENSLIRFAPLNEVDLHSAFTIREIEDRNRYTANDSSPGNLKHELNVRFERLKRFLLDILKQIQDKDMSCVANIEQIPLVLDDICSVYRMIDMKQGRCLNKEILTLIVQIVQSSKNSLFHELRFLSVIRINNVYFENFLGLGQKIDSLSGNNEEAFRRYIVVHRDIIQSAQSDCFNMARKLISQLKLRHSANIYEKQVLFLETLLLEHGHVKNSDNQEYRASPPPAQSYYNSVQSSDNPSDDAVAEFGFIEYGIIPDRIPKVDYLIDKATCSTYASIILFQMSSYVVTLYERLENFDKEIELDELTILFQDRMSYVIGKLTSFIDEFVSAIDLDEERNQILPLLEGISELNVNLFNTVEQYSVVIRINLNVEIARCVQLAEEYFSKIDKVIRKMKTANFIV